MRAKKLYVLLLIVFLSITGCNKKDNSFIMDDFMLGSGDDLVVCGIKLGETRIEDISGLMENYPMIDLDLQNMPIITQHDEVIFYHYLFKEEVGGSVDLAFQDDYLTSISYNIPGIYLGQVINKFGNPDYMFVKGDITERGIFYFSHMVYTDLGLAIIAMPDKWGNQLVLDENSEVFHLALLKTESTQSCNDAVFTEYDPSEYCYEWLGYGIMSELYPNAIIED